jgi:condensin complex subunit 3
MRKLIGPTHPRALSIKQRELIVKNGLGDREPTVRAVAANLLATWLDVADVDSDAVDPSGGDKERFESRVLAFLNLFDLNEGEVATNALSRIFQAKADIIDNIEFDGRRVTLKSFYVLISTLDAYWTNLSPERAYLARVFIEHCRETKDDVRLESSLPVVTLIAFRTQEWYNLLQDEDPVLQDLDDGERRRREDEIASKEVIVAELLKLAVNLDYADEIGRRKMFELVRK